MTSQPSIEQILVTGGAGYIGSVTAHVLISRGFGVTVIDDCSTGHADAVPKSARFIRANLNDRSAVQEALIGCTAVIHFAGKSLVNESVSNPDLYRQSNVEGSQNLIKEMCTSGISRLVFSSSAAIYGEPGSTPIAENAPTAPKNPYGETKLTVERIISETANAEGMAGISLRYFNAAGAIGSESEWIGERHFPETHLIPNVLQSTAQNPVKVFGATWNTPDGTCIRDYVHVVDLAEAHIQALTLLKPSTHQVFNLGSGKGYSVYEILRIASEVLGAEVPYIDAPAREGDPVVLIADISKARSELKWNPSRDLRMMIEDSLKVSSRV